MRSKSGHDVPSVLQGPGSLSMLHASDPHGVGQGSYNDPPPPLRAPFSTWRHWEGAPRPKKRLGQILLQPIKNSLRLQWV